VKKTLDVGLNAQVRPRDLRMIHTSDAVACYRPAAYTGEHSHGTFEELSYAVDHGRATGVVHDESRDGGVYGRDVPSPFPGPSRNVFDVVEGLIHDLDQQQEHKRARGHR
jgi:hypothetical protein